MTRELILTDERLASICLQLCILYKKYLDEGESPETLIETYLHRMEEDRVRWLEEDGKVIAFADFAWISGAEDIPLAKANRWEEITPGPVLLVINTVCTRPNQITQLLRQAPRHDYICWWDENDTIHAPKGFPENVEETVRQTV